MDFLFKDFIIAPILNKIVFLSTVGTEKSWTFDVDWNFPVNDAKPKMFLESSNEDTGKNSEPEKQDEKLIQLITVSEAHDLLSFTVSDKSIFLCKIAKSSAVVQSRRVFLRTASVIRFSRCGKLLFLADKTGDTFEYSCEDVDKPARWIFGHISQILDLQLGSDLSFIAASDRDEKIRVTKYPETHDIEAFCVGHREFVSSLAFLNNVELLVSASGDKTLRFWNFKAGKQLQLMDLSFVPITIALSEDNLKGLLAVSSDENKLYVYRYCICDSTVNMDLEYEKTYGSSFQFTIKGNLVYIKYIDGEKKLKVDKVAFDDSPKMTELDLSDDASVDIRSFPDIFQSFDVSLLFKKRYDNVKQYIDRKRARIENQNKSK